MKILLLLLISFLPSYQSQILTNSIQKTIYKRFILPGSVWTGFVFKKHLKPVKSRVICGSFCSSPRNHHCGGFVYQDETQSCLFADPIAGGGGFMAPVAESGPFYFNKSRLRKSDQNTRCVINFILYHIYMSLLL